MEALGRGLGRHLPLREFKPGIWHLAFGSCIRQIQAGQAVSMPLA